MARILRHPELWAEALRMAVALVPRRWWRRPPFLPVPHRRYVSWRLATAYGDPRAPVAGRDLIEFLRWRARQRRT